MRSARIALPNEYIEFGDFREQSGRIATERLLSLQSPPSAILVANNEMMAGALFAIRRRRVKVPRNLSLVGFDDARWARYSDPPLTVVSQPTEAMGQKAAELLLGRLRGEKEANTVIFKPELIVRNSTTAPK
jgi:DNA-binding LacI/PurR family transcriptional regulator